MRDSDQVFISRVSGELLIYPKTEVNDEKWLQKYVIEQDRHKDEEDKAFYAKGDAVKLEKFLTQEREATVRIIKQKCLEHSKNCEACDILSHKENTLIREIWDSVTSEEGSDGRQVIKHTYVHRHNIQDTFPPWRSNVGEARSQAKRVI